MRYFLKSYLPIYLSSNKICVGYANKNYIELEDNKKNKELLKKLLTVGIVSTDNADLFARLKKHSFLQKRVAIKRIVNRNELFLNYLNVNEFNHIFEKKIIIFGAGAGGATLIYLLAQFGFKNLVVIDGDKVNSSDIFRVSIFDKQDINSFKVDALSNKINKNFGINIQTKNIFVNSKKEIKMNLKEFKPELIIKACDPDLKFLYYLNEECFLQKIPYFNLAYSYEILKIGPFYVPGATSCANFLNELQKRTFGEHYDFKKNKKLFDDYLVHPSVTFNINILSNFALKEIVFYFLEKYELVYSLGKLLQFNPLNYDIGYIKINCGNSCKVCN